MSELGFPKEIIEIKGKQKTSFVTISFDTGEFIKIQLDLVYQFKLNKGVKLSESTYNQILRTEKINQGKKFAYNSCLKRVRTEKEVQRLLKRKGFFDDEILEIISFLIEFKLINDEEFVHTAINYYYSKKKFGASRIKLELLKKGFKSEIITKALSEFFISGEDEQFLAEKIIEKKRNLIFSKPESKRKTYAFQILSRAGLSSSTCQSVVQKFFSDVNSEFDYE